jgi:HD superfamily phosphodiesterase
MMKTTAGKARAESRHRFMEEFLEQMRDEVSGRA